MPGLQALSPVGECRREPIDSLSLTFLSEISNIFKKGRIISVSNISFLHAAEISSWVRRLCQATATAPPAGSPPVKAGMGASEGGERTAITGGDSLTDPQDHSALVNRGPSPVPAVTPTVTATQWAPQASACGHILRQFLESNLSRPGGREGALTGHGFL